MYVYVFSAFRYLNVYVSFWWLELNSGSDKCPIYVILSAAWLFAAGRFLLMKQVCGLERTDIGIACGNSASWKNSICEQLTTNMFSPPKIRPLGMQLVLVVLYNVVIMFISLIVIMLCSVLNVIFEIFFFAFVFVMFVLLIWANPRLNMLLNVSTVIFALIFKSFSFKNIWKEMKMKRNENDQERNMILVQSWHVLALITAVLCHLQVCHFFFFFTYLNRSISRSRITLDPVSACAALLETRPARNSFFFTQNTLFCTAWCVFRALFWASTFVTGHYGLKCSQWSIILSRLSLAAILGWQPVTEEQTVHAAKLCKTLT